MHELVLGHAGPAELALDGGHLDAGTLDLGPEAALRIALDDPAAFSAGGPPITAGDLLLDGTLQVTAPDDFVPLPGQELLLIDYGSRSGALDSMLLPTGFDGVLFSLLLDDAAGEATLLISAARAVPEPATVLLLALGTAALLVARRRKGLVRG